MSTAMEASSQNSKSALFKVYLRLRPPPLSNFAQSSSTNAPDRFISVEDAAQQDDYPTHITLNPPNDNRRRAVEKFAFTKVFEENKGQLDVFEGTGVLGLVEGVLGAQGGDGRDGLLATLGVTGSGKTHTILGSRSQRGLTQLSLDVLFRSISNNILDPSTAPSLHATVAASDASEAQVMSAQMFIDSMFSDPTAQSRASSRAPTPMVVRTPSLHIYNNTSEETHASDIELYPSMQGISNGSPKSIRVVSIQDQEHGIQVPGAYPDSEDSILMSTHSPSKILSSIPSYMQSTMSKARKYMTKSPITKLNAHMQGDSYPPPTPRRNLLQRPSVLPQLPDISNVTVHADSNAEYSILISMYEVYNDRIFDLLTPALPNKGTKDFRRRPLLFKPTEQSPDRKVVAGLRKIICSTMREALMVLEAGLHERRVAGTGSNSVSSRSHGFFCVEVKKRRRGGRGIWGGSAFTIVDLAGSERARDAKTQGATLQEAGKINESLMYLGQCLQMQSDLGSSTKPNLVPFRQCKLTELLFSNSFPSPNSQHQHRNPQRATMIVTADPLGDFNATSQILRYSALAREITVPRIPSVTSTILLSSTASHYFSPRNGSGRHSPTDTERETMEIAALEIARMSEEIDGLRAELISEQEQRIELEAHLESMQERHIEIEAEVREECYLEMEKKLESEMRRWKATWAEESERNEVHLDRKLDIVARMGEDGISDEEDKENSHSGARIDSRPSAKGVSQEDLENENDRLRREVEKLKRDIQNRSPTRNSRMPLRESRIEYVKEKEILTVEREFEQLRIASPAGKERKQQQQYSRIGGGSVVSSAGNSDRATEDSMGSRSPTKKVVRKLGARKWDLMDDGQGEGSLL